jgi:hypothetical protein
MSGVGIGLPWKFPVPPNAPSQLAGTAGARVSEGLSTSLILILLPLKDKQRDSYARELFRAVKPLPVRSTFSGG